ncbi:hypothetical protein C8F01DRAFT_177465 [Mycena amicta]|nr:hypothetical protein C8F01DRAFT_177465 [Mycena amicta]
MSIAYTFRGQDLLNTNIVGPDNIVYYTTQTTSGFRGRKVTTIQGMNASGVIDWRAEHFILNGVERKWDDLKHRSGGIFSSEREWIWGDCPFILKYHHSHTELLATPNFRSTTGTVRFTPYQGHLLRDNEPATISFPFEMQDASARMFLLMAVLQTDIHRQDENSRRRRRRARGSNFH